MKTTSRRPVVAAIVALLSAQLLSPWALSSAHADQSGTPPLTGATATIESRKLFGHLSQVTVTEENGTVHKVFAYCIDRGITPDAADAPVVDWAQYQPRPGTGFNDPVKRQKVGWIILNSYPAVPIEKVRQAVGIPDLSEGDAVLGTQQAIWTLTNNATDGPDVEEAKKVYDFYTSKGFLDQAAVGMNAAGPQGFHLTGPGQFEPGKPYGPVQVRMTGAGAIQSVVPQQEFVDAAGQPMSLSTIKDGDQFWLKTVAGQRDLTARITVTGAGPATGLIVSPDYFGDRIQPVMLIEQGPVSVSASLQARATATSQNTATPATNSPAQTLTTVPPTASTASVIPTATATRTQTATPSPSATATRTQTSTPTSSSTLGNSTATSSSPSVMVTSSVSVATPSGSVDVRGSGVTVTTPDPRTNASSDIRITGDQPSPATSGGVVVAAASPSSTRNSDGAASMAPTATVTVTAAAAHEGPKPKGLPYTGSSSR